MKNVDIKLVSLPATINDVVDSKYACNTVSDIEGLNIDTDIIGEEKIRLS